MHMFAISGISTNKNFVNSYQGQSERTESYFVAVAPPAGEGKVESDEGNRMVAYAKGVEK